MQEAVPETIENTTHADTESVSPGKPEQERIRRAIS
jgi:hypothetical protein